MDSDRRKYVKKRLRFHRIGLVALIILTGCAAAGIGLKEPKGEDTILVIGSVIVDLFQYRGTSETYRDGIDVIIAGRHSKQNKVEHTNYWVKTDAHGYFALSNVPKGDYAIRGFRIQTFGPSFYLTVANPLLTANDKYTVLKGGRIPQNASQFNLTVQGRIIDLRHNYFIIDRGETAHHKTYFRYDDLKTVTGEPVIEPDVLTYFKRTYSDSHWFKR